MPRLEPWPRISSGASSAAAHWTVERTSAEVDGVKVVMDEAHRTGDFDDEAEIDIEFHHAISECAHNIILLHTLRSCYRLLSEGVFQNRLLVFSVPGAREALLHQHRAIYAAIKAGDPTAARQAAMTTRRLYITATPAALPAKTFRRYSQLSEYMKWSP